MNCADVFGHFIGIVWCAPDLIQFI